MRKKNKDEAKPAESANGSLNGNGKRKAEDPTPVEEDSKKAKVEDAPEA